MFKNFLFSLDKPASDVIGERVDKEPVVSKYWFNLGGAIAAIIATILISLFSIFSFDQKAAPITSSINMKTKKTEQLIVLPFPHQSFKNVSAWIVDAVTTAYSFDFVQIDKQINSAGYYFTPQGYQTYLTALQMTKVRDDIVAKKLQVSILPLQTPILINGGTFGSTEFWRFKLPVLISYYGGKEPIIKKQIVEVLVLRVPAYENPKGLAIAEFNMAGM